MIMHRNRLIIFGIAMTTIFAVAAGCGDSNDNSKDSSDEAVVPVTAVVAEEQVITPALDYSGSVEAWLRAALGSEIPGRIVTLNCDVGDIVRKDSLLVELGSETLIQARAQYDAVAKDWERIKTLRESGTVTQQAYDQIEAAYKTAKTKKYLDVGEVYSLFPGQAGSPAIIELMQIDTVKVAVAVTESQYHRLTLGQQATLRLDAYPDTQFVGTVSRIDPTVNTKTRTANVEIRFVNDSGIIKPGMFGFVSISLPSKNALLVNRDVLIKQEGTGIFYVFKVQNDTASRVNVITGDNFGSLVEIKSGLEDGDTVVTTGKMKIKTGSKVKIASAEVTQ